MIEEPKQYCSFILGDGVYGIDALRVQEIVQSRPTTPVPLAPSCVDGLMNLRGQIDARRSEWHQPVVVPARRSHASRRRLRPRAIAVSRDSAVLARAPPARTSPESPARARESSGASMA